MAKSRFAGSPKPLCLHCASRNGGGDKDGGWWCFSCKTWIVPPVRKRVVPRGNCYVATEALYHLLGGRQSSWHPCRLKLAHDTHWFLVHNYWDGIVLDPTQQQFKGQRPNYALGRRAGFLTKGPSARARTLMKSILTNTAPQRTGR